MRFYKKWSLIKRYDMVLATLCGLFVTSCLLFSVHWILTLVIGCAYLCLGAFYYYGVLLPIRETNKIFERFNLGYDANSIYALPVGYSDAMNRALSKIGGFLDNQQTIKLSNRQAQYLALQNQINPHFLYNTLEAIRGDALSEGINTIATTTEALATFFRYTISNVDSLVTLEEELSNAENYFAIQNYRFGDKISMEIIIEEGEKELLSCQIPKLTLQPIIENAIIHGLENKIGRGKVVIRMTSDGKRLIIEIEDDGVGMKEAVLRDINGYLKHLRVDIKEDEKLKVGGIALKNVNERIHLLFGEPYGLRVLSVENYGTQVIIELPLQFQTRR